MEDDEPWDFDRFRWWFDDEPWDFGWIKIGRPVFFEAILRSLRIAGALGASILGESGEPIGAKVTLVGYDPGCLGLISQ
jgi:hypothetical protein